MVVGNVVVSDAYVAPSCARAQRAERNGYGRMAFRTRMHRGQSF